MRNIENVDAEYYVPEHRYRVVKPDFDKSFIILVPEPITITLEAGSILADDQRCIKLRSVVSVENLGEDPKIAFLDNAIDFLRKLKRSV